MRCSQGRVWVQGHTPRRPPPQTRGRHRTDRTPVDHVEEPALCVRASEALTGDRLGRGVVPSQGMRDQAPRLRVCPGLARGRGVAAPPDSSCNPKTHSGSRTARALTRSRPWCCARRAEQGACSSVWPSSTGAPPVGRPGGWLPHGGAAAPSRPARCTRPPPGQCPPPWGLARETRRLRHEMLQAVTVRGSQPGRDGLGTVRLLRQALHAPRVQDRDDITDGLDGIPPSGPWAAGTAAGHWGGRLGPAGHGRRPRGGGRPPTAYAQPRSRGTSEVDHRQWLPIRKKNAPRALALSVVSVQRYHCKRIETARSLIAQLLPQLLHAVTPQSLARPVALLVIASSLPCSLHLSEPCRE